MPLDPKAKQFLQDHSSFLETHYSLVEVRKNFELSSYVDEVEEVGEILNKTIMSPHGEMNIRIYYPKTKQDKYPILLYFHGGGWVLGNINTHDPICRVLTNRAGCITISVDYHLAPEYKFPAAVDDAYASLKWVKEHSKSLKGDPANIAVAGDSAGGNLAAAVSILAAENSIPLTLQLLIYPATDFTGNYPSRQKYKSGYFLTEEAMKFFTKSYISPQDSHHYLASPQLYPRPKDLPEAVIITAEYDPLRDEGEAYGKKLKDAGVNVQILRYDGMIHGFVSFLHVFEKGKEALDQAGQKLKTAFSS
jgi:acetyl esterase